MSKPFHIAIDGPVAAGKGTISRLVADRLGFLYVDTGAMYRVGAWLGLQSNTSWENESSIAQLISSATIEMRNPTSVEKDGRLTTVIVNGEDVSWQIRTEEVSKGASVVASHKSVRKILVEKQKLIAEGQNVVMEGRDITYAVLPQAQLKIFLTAGDTVRARRRHLQLLTKGTNITFEQVYTELLKRDALDMGRDTDPLRKVDDAWEIDTSDLSIEQGVEVIVAKVLVMRENNAK